jgi:hypothetical protein
VSIRGMNKTYKIPCQHIPKVGTPYSSLLQVDNLIEIIVMHNSTITGTGEV